MLTNGSQGSQVGGFDEMIHWEHLNTLFSKAANRNSPQVKADVASDWSDHWAFGVWLQKWLNMGDEKLFQEHILLLSICTLQQLDKFDIECVCEWQMSYQVSQYQATVQCAILEVVRQILTRTAKLKGHNQHPTIFYGCDDNVDQWELNYVPACFNQYLTLASGQKIAARFTYKYTSNTYYECVNLKSMRFHFLWTYA